MAESLVQHNGQQDGVRFSSSYVPVILLTAVIVALSTRFLTSAPRRPAEDVTTSLPYWVPALGHLLEFIFFNGSFLRQTRDAFPCGAFKLNLAGRYHTVFYDVNVFRDAISENQGFLEASVLRKRVATYVFALQAKNTGALETLHEKLDNASRQQASELASRAIHIFQTTLPDIVTFNTSPVDQAPWERLCIMQMPESPKIDHVEVGLYSLVQSYVSHSTSVALAGENLLENMPFVPTELEAISRSFGLLLLGIPRWVPFPGLISAYIARRRLLNTLWYFHDALDRDAAGQEQYPGSEWRGLVDVSELLKRSDGILKEAELSRETRASHTLCLLYLFATKISGLSYWMLVHILTRPSLLRELREEIETYARASQPPSDFGIAEPAQLKLDAEGLWSKCRKLKACAWESLRLYDRSWSVRKVKADFKSAVSDHEDGQTMAFKKGEYIDIPSFLENTDPARYDKPMEWDWKRHGLAEDESGLNSETDDLQLTAGNMGLPPALEEAAFRTCLAFVAGFLVLWDVKPAGSGVPAVPVTNSGGIGVVALPRGDLKVHIRRRALR
ncbi:hypothetical protein LTS18_003243 [Coniosporium uncinatum]|uniref:Uncharacterized protein n=1 Tax=Coniosporium uncinatum TaxID=93489 RepID=A0ACC3D7A9_9PEZI|nr:hypothetical protein LTS18_003243 [Coniosporium uncinatum]